MLPRNGKPGEESVSLNLRCFLLFEIGTSFAEFCALFLEGNSAAEEAETPCDYLMLVNGYTNCSF